MPSPVQQHPSPHPAQPLSLLPKDTGGDADSVLGWSAWLRVLAVLPLMLALWLAVWWANGGAVPW